MKLIFASVHLSFKFFLFLTLSSVLVILQGTCLPILGQPMVGPEVDFHDERRRDFDRRGYSVSPTASDLSITPLSGAVRYSYPIYAGSIDDFPFKVDMNYCSNVSTRAFAGFVQKGNEFWHGNLVGIPYESYWKETAAMARPVWLLGVNGFAVQALSHTRKFESFDRPLSGLSECNAHVDDRYFLWNIEGYDYCNRLNDITKQRDVIRLLRSDGSILELKNTVGYHDILPAYHGDTNVRQHSLLVTGYYEDTSPGAVGFAKVEYTCGHGVIPPYVDGGGDTVGLNLLPPRTVRYYPGDGLEYVFREYQKPFGDQYHIRLDTTELPQPPEGDPLLSMSVPNVALVGLSPAIPSFGDLSHGIIPDFPPDHWISPAPVPLPDPLPQQEVGSIPYGARPTVFYLEEINHAGRTLITFARQWHRTSCDSLENKAGRAPLVGFTGHKLSYGDNFMTVESFGQTHTFRYNKFIGSGSFSQLGIQKIPLGNSSFAESYERNDWRGIGEGSIFAYITSITNPIGQSVSFEYEKQDRIHEYEGVGTMMYIGREDSHVSIPPPSICRVLWQFDNLRLRTIHDIDSVTASITYRPSEVFNPYEPRSISFPALHSGRSDIAEKVEWKANGQPLRYTSYQHTDEERDTTIVGSYDTRVVDIQHQDHLSSASQYEKLRYRYFMVGARSVPLKDNQGNNIGEMLTDYPYHFPALYLSSQKADSVEHLSFTSYRITQGSVPKVDPKRINSAVVYNDTDTIATSRKFILYEYIPLQPIHIGISGLARGFSRLARRATFTASPSISSLFDSSGVAENISGIPNDIFSLVPTARLVEIDDFFSLPFLDTVPLLNKQNIPTPTSGDKWSHYYKSPQAPDTLLNWEESLYNAYRSLGDSPYANDVLTIRTSGRRYIPPIYERLSSKRTYTRTGILTSGTFTDYQRNWHLGYVQPGTTGNILPGKPIASGRFFPGSIWTTAALPPKVVDKYYSYTTEEGIFPTFRNVLRAETDANGKKTIYEYSQSKQGEILHNSYSPETQTFAPPIPFHALPSSPLFSHTLPLTIDKPSSVATVIRKVDTGGTVYDDTLSSSFVYNQSLLPFGALQYSINSNNYASMYSYDNGGRLNAAWLPGDFPKPEGRQVNLTNIPLLLNIENRKRQFTSHDTVFVSVPNTSPLFDVHAVQLEFRFKISEISDGAYSPQFISNHSPLSFDVIQIDEAGNVANSFEFILDNYAVFPKVSPFCQSQIEFSLPLHGLQTSDLAGHKFAFVINGILPGATVSLNTEGISSAPALVAAEATANFQQWMLPFLSEQDTDFDFSLRYNYED